MFVLMIVILVWIVFFFKDIIIPFVRLEIKGNVEEAKQLLIDRGLYGYLSVALVPGLQMVVVFISAEFIQISAGLAYPWYIAAGL